MGLRGTVVFDLDGVVYLGGEKLPGSTEALWGVEEMGYSVLFCTNNSSRRRAATAEKIRRITGYEARAEQVLSSATAAGHLVSGKAERAVVVGGEGIVEALAEAGVEVTNDWRDADVVVVGVDFEFGYERLAAAMSAVRSGAWLVATNLDPTYPTPGGLAPGAGPFVAAVERASGAAAEVAGKPEQPMRSLISSRISGDDVWVVGDRPDTDLAMAVAEGWRSVLVLTGVTPDPEGARPEPDLVARTVGAVPGLIASWRGRSGVS